MITNTRETTTAVAFLALPLMIGNAMAYEPDYDADSAAMLTSPYDIFAPAAWIDNFSSASTTDLTVGYWGEGAPGIYWDDGRVVLEAALTQADEKQTTQIKLNGDTDNLSATVSLSSESEIPANRDSRIRVRLTTEWLRENEGDGEDRTGDLTMQISLGMSGDGGKWIGLWVGRKNSDGSHTDVDVYQLPAFDQITNIVPALDTPYDLSIRRDRERNVAIFSVNDITAEYPLGDFIYRATAAESQLEVQVESGPGKAIAHVHSVETDTLSYDFTTAPSMTSYSPLWNSRYGQSTVETNGGLLQLKTDNNNNRPTRLASDNRTDYLAVDMGVSSDTVTTGEGAFRISLLNKKANLVSDGNEDVGDVYAMINIESAAPGLYTAYYCAWQETAIGFIERISNDDSCQNQFTSAIEPDVLYPASVEIDRESPQLTFRFNGETVQHALPALFDIADPQVRLEARTDSDSYAVGLFDNLQLGTDALPIAESPDRLLIDPASSGPADDSTTSDDGSSSGGGALGLLTLALGMPAFIRRRTAASPRSI